MRVGILTMEVYENRAKDSVGSSRIRGSWLTKYWPEAELFRIGQKYDVIIFQKAYHSRLMKVFEGIKILDICDPDWIEGRPIKECVELCDAVTCSSQALVDFIKTITDKPVYFIPDRMDMNYYTQKKEHKGDAKKVVWFGYSNNHKLIDAALFTIKKLGLKLTVISDVPYMPSMNVEGIYTTWLVENLTNIRYNQDTINEDLVAFADIIINPRIEDGKFKFKSDNKTFTAWALGIPVAKDSDDLERFISEDERKKEAELRLAEVHQHYRTEQSVEQYKEVINSINK